ncbi:MAG: phenylalanine--tRNA ligase subunit beta [Alphaproteobacteria bacterium]|nr:MAG: phenylalanine--tRNA ligase subunit beta [Alphaproteobacteria bacterium]
MKFTHSWLLDHLDTDLSVTRIAEILTRIGLEVEEMGNPATPIKDILVGRILEADRHPNADKLQVCLVDLGQRKLQVVCGAPNARSGIKVAVALPGTVIPATGAVLRKGNVRGIDSHAMMCSIRELCLGDDHDGIIEVPSSVEIGTFYADYLGVNDTVYHINVTPNRGDCFGVRGVARDLAAAGAGVLRSLTAGEIPGSFVSPISVAVDFTQTHTHRCTYFTGRYVRGVVNRPSPQWMQNRMRACGIKVISGLVDITNYLAFDVGQPTHVFDAQTLKGNMHVRCGREGESLSALDDLVYPVAGHTVIADDSKPISLAGIMGGKDTGSYDTTTDVFLESAFFNPITTAETGRMLNISSDARTRFERGTDPLMVRFTLEKATKMIVDHCGGEVSHVVEVGKAPSTKTSVYLPASFVATHTGVAIPWEEQQKTLSDLAFDLKVTSEGLHAHVPTWRHDIAVAADLCEEILRIHGYDTIPHTPLPPLPISKQGQSSVFSSDMMRLRRKAVTMGFYEQITWSFMREADQALFASKDDDLVLRNPISTELGVMRPSLLPNLLALLGRNQRRGKMNHRVCEAGLVFGSHYKNRQERHVSGVLGGRVFEGSWRNKNPEAVSVYDAKAMLYGLVAEWGLDPATMQIGWTAPPYFHPGRSGVLMLGPKVTVGVFGELHPRVLGHYDIKGTVVGFELFVDALPRARVSNPKAYEVTNLQSVQRDFAFLLHESVPAGGLIATVRSVSKRTIADVRVFDVYVGENIPQGKKSVALSVIFQPVVTTLTEAEISDLSALIITAVAQKHEGICRDG